MSIGNPPSIDNPPPLLETTNLVPCFIVQLTDRTYERLREWVSVCAHEEARSNGIVIPGKKLGRMEKIIDALAKKIFFSFVDVVEACHFSELPRDEVMRDLIDEAMGGLWYSYFTEDRTGDGTAFGQDLKGRHKTLVIEL